MTSIPQTLVNGSSQGFQTKLELLKHPDLNYFDLDHHHDTTPFESCSILVFTRNPLYQYAENMNQVHRDEGNGFIIAVGLVVGTLLYFYAHTPVQPSQMQSSETWTY